MKGESIRGHGLTLLSTVSGIAGTGMIFTGATHGSFVEISRGVPLLLAGLWWCGRELALSTHAQREKGRS